MVVMTVIECRWVWLRQIMAVGGWQLHNAAWLRVLVHVLQLRWIETGFSNRLWLAVTGFSNRCKHTLSNACCSSVPQLVKLPVVHVCVIGRSGEFSRVVGSVG